MPVPFDPARFPYAVVAYPPEAPDAYRLVCLAATARDAWTIAHLLRAFDHEGDQYSVRPAGAAPTCARGLTDCEQCRSGRFRDGAGDAP